jgi:hypothetical protein
MHNNHNWFELNPKKTIFAILSLAFISLLCIDYLSGQFLLQNGWLPDYYLDHVLKNNAKYELTVPLKHVFYTNSLGFKDRLIRKVALNSNKYRILFVGDSFTEGAGYPYDETFVGIFDNFLGNNQYEVLNAGVRSYSPKLYYFKLKHLIDGLQLKINELFVFIDITDPYDEYYRYQNIPNSFVYFKKLIRSFFANNFYVINNIRNYYYKKNAAIDYDWLLALWSLDKKAFDSWGQKGLLLCDKYMEQVYLLCKKHDIKLTIAVYPWPIHILKRDLNSIQVIHWKNFAKERSIDFLNYFPNFINKEDPNWVIDKYFIPGDFHWNKNGHKIVAAVLITNWIISKK